MPDIDDVPLPEVTPRQSVEGFDEKAFKSWYADWAKVTGINPNPDDPKHQYDYRAAFQAGVKPEIANDGLYHWPSQFKLEGHPNLIVEGVNTKTGKRVKDASKK